MCSVQPNSAQGRPSCLSGRHHRHTTRQSTAGVAPSRMCPSRHDTCICKFVYSEAKNTEKAMQRNERRDHERPELTAHESRRAAGLAWPWGARRRRAAPPRLGLGPRPSPINTTAIARRPLPRIATILTPTARRENLRVDHPLTDHQPPPITDSPRGRLALALRPRPTGPSRGTCTRI